VKLRCCAERAGDRRNERHRGKRLADVRVKAFLQRALLIFAAQHLYIIVTTGWTVGLASVLLAALLAYPLAFVFDRGGNSIVGPAILHTSSNAPVTVLAMPDDALAAALVPHMAVVLVSLYLVFGLGRFFIPEATPVSGNVQ
jgi:hypothetical protein